MIPGNCLIGAVLIWLIYGGTIVRSYRLGTRIPHWVVVCRDGRLRHFTATRDFLPPPLSYVLFLGRFETHS